MKRPYFNREERESILLDTLKGSHLKLALAIKIYLRDVKKEKGCISMYRAKKQVVKLVNQRIFKRN